MTLYPDRVQGHPLPISLSPAENPINSLKEPIKQCTEHNQIFTPLHVHKYILSDEHGALIYKTAKTFIYNTCQDIVSVCIGRGFKPHQSIWVFLLEITFCVHNYI